MDDNNTETIRERLQNAVSAVTNLQDGTRIIYEGKDNGFVINGPNKYRGTITDTQLDRSVVIVDGVEEVSLDRIVEIEHDS